MRRYRWMRAGLMAGLMLLLSGCLFRATEDLYQSPERSADYRSLTEEIKSVKDALAQEYGTEVDDTSVITGDNTALIQLQDMDGDGVRETAVTFFRVPNAEKPLKIYFFTKTSEENYTVSAMVEGNGSAIYQVDYVDLNGSGYKEVVVSWQMSTGAYLLGAYSMDDSMTRNVKLAMIEQATTPNTSPGMPGQEKLRAAEWMTTAYSEYALSDLDQDSRVEVAVIRIDPAGTNSVVEIYGWRDGAFLARDTAPLSSGMIGLEKNSVKQNFLDGDAPIRALYITSVLASGKRAVDVIAYQDKVLTNVSLDPQTGTSRDLLDRYVDLEPTDVNEDGVLELPVPISVPGRGDFTAFDIYMLRWSQYDKEGRRHQVCTTYHNTADGWYLIIPDEWKDQVTLSRYDGISGQRAVVFSHLEGENQPPSRFLVVYKFTSQFERANTSRRFPLREEEDAVYAASFYEDTHWSCGMSDMELLESFHLIQSGWSD